MPMKHNADKLEEVYLINENDWKCRVVLHLSSGTYDSIGLINSA